jgi:hypothetical protein
MKILHLLTTRRLFLLLSVLALGWVCSGCGSTEAENTSQRPWNSPEGWQSGGAGMVAPPH